MSVQRKLDKDGVTYLWSKIKSMFALKTDVPSASNTTPGMDTPSGQVGGATTYARGDHTHPKDTSKADINSPNFTGTPTAPTAQAGTNNTQLATTAFVKNSIDNINMSAYQHKLTPGRNIEITENNVINGVDLAPLQALIATKGNAKVLSKTWAEYLALSNDEKLDVNTIYAVSDKNFIMYKNVPYGKTIANPNGEATIQLTKLQIVDTIYSIPEAGTQYWTETDDEFYKSYDIPGITADDGYIYTDGEWYNEGKSQMYYGHFLFHQANEMSAIIVMSPDSKHRYFYLLSTNQRAVDWIYKEINHEQTGWLVPSENGSDTGTERKIIYGSFVYNGTTWYISSGLCNHSEADQQTFDCPVLSNWSILDTLEEVGLKIISASNAKASTSASVGIGTEGKVLYHIEDGNYVAYLDDEGVFSGSDFKVGTTSLVTLINNKPDGVSELNDVTLTNLADGQVLKWDDTNNKWINANESGGTTVVANPSGSATDTLNKVQIDNTIYSLPSGGGGGGSGSGYEETVLWDTGGTTSRWAEPIVATLNDSLRNYDSLRIRGDTDAHEGVILDIPTSEIPSDYSTYYFQNAGYRILYANADSDTQVSLYTTTGVTVTYTKIVGVKYGSGGGSSGSGYEETVLLDNQTTVTSGSTLTLDDDYTKYDMIIIDASTSDYVDWRDFVVIDVSQIVLNEEHSRVLLRTSNALYGLRYKFTGATSIYAYGDGSRGITIYKIVGIKFGGGSGQNLPLSVVNGELCIVYDDGN